MLGKASLNATSQDAWASGQGPSPRQKHAGRRHLYASQLMHPEWMLEVPDDLPTHWYVRRASVVGETVDVQRPGNSAT